ncbi:MAG TPA: ATP-binding protein [Kofleriaceae bacterium]
MAARILLVDDDASQRKLNRLRLEDAGFCVDSAANASEALIRARACAPDLIMSDVVMGEADGFALCCALTQDAELADIPIVLVSAKYGNSVDVARARSVGAETLLKRSTTFEAELAAVKACLGEREQRQLKSQLEAAELLGGCIAHDFNNLLAIILANASFLVDDLQGNDVQRGGAQEIADAAQRAVSLSRQLLAFSNRRMVTPTEVDVVGLVAELDRLMRRLVGENIELVVTRADDVGPVRGDAGQLEQVILNLVVNARDAMPAGGRLTIETTPAGPYVRVVVRDTGTGMSSETMRRVFEPLFTTKERGRGTGLGLAICAGIVERCGGHIHVSSELGRGSAFEVYLPRVAA